MVKIMIYYTLNAPVAPNAPPLTIGDFIPAGGVPPQKFAAAIVAPVPMIPGGKFANVDKLVKLSANEYTFLTAHGSAACIIGMITCTAVIIKNNASATICAYHANGGIISESEFDEVRRQLAGQPPTEYSVLYVMPNGPDEYYGSYVDSLVTQYHFAVTQICVVSCPNQPIDSVYVNGSGQIYFA
jgi:hypothetical protein